MISYDPNNTTRNKKTMLVAFLKRKLALSQIEGDEEKTNILKAHLDKVNRIVPVDTNFKKMGENKNL